MKKILFLLTLVAVCFASNGQTAMTATNALTLDTIANTETVNLTSQVKETGTISLILVVTKISGTVGGTATIQGSNDGTNYADLETAYTITDASQTKKYDYDKRKYRYYRFKCTGTGTMSASVKATLYVNKVPN